MAVYKRGDVWWYSFIFAGKRIQESAKTTSKTLAKQAEQQRHRELEQGFNGITDDRKERIRTVSELAADYLTEYKLRHKSVTFAEYAIGNLNRHVGTLMSVEVSERTVKEYQSSRLRENAAPKTINEEVGFLLRILGESGEAIRARLRRQKSLKLPVRHQVGKAYTAEEKERLLKAAKQGRSKVIYPALMLALNAGMRDAEIRGLQWGRLDLNRGFLTVGASKTEAGEGRTIPLNSALKDALEEYAQWYTERFGPIQADWFVFPYGKPTPSDPTRPMVTLKTSWSNVREKAKVEGRWHDNRHTMITDLAENGTGDEVIRDIAGHVSRQMLKHYSHIRMDAKRKALEALVAKPAVPKQEQPNPSVETQSSEAVSTKITTV